MMNRQRVYPIWVKKVKNDSFYSYLVRSFDFGITAEASDLESALKSIQEKIEKKAYTLQREGLELPIPGSSRVENKSEFKTMEIVNVDLDAYKEFVETVLN